jgi:MoaA/NifB/PqqE/SkfB family radical SAM enzyme
MKTKRLQRIERIKECILEPSEFLKELKTRLRAPIDKANFLIGNIRPPLPATVVFVVNDTCNARCKTCDFGLRPEGSTQFNYIKDKGELPFEDFCKVIDELAFYRPSIWFMATEPLAYSHLIPTIEYVNKKNMEFQLTTNGILLPKMADEIFYAGVRRLNISLDGPTAEIHDNIRGVTGCFQAILDGISQISELRKKNKTNYPKITVNCCISNHNYNYLLQLVSTLVALDIDSISFTHLEFINSEMAREHNRKTSEYHVSPCRVFQADPDNVDVAVLRQEIIKIRKKFSDYRINFSPNMKLKELDKYYHKPLEPIEDFDTCYYPWRYSHILPNGDVIVSYLCFAGKLGNIRMQSFPQIWHNEKYRRFRKFLRKNNGCLPACCRCSGVGCSYYL